jgi:hypothetical protein
MFIANPNSLCTCPVFPTDLDENNGIKYLLFSIALEISSSQSCPGRRFSLSSQGFNSAVFKSL